MKEQDIKNYLQKFNKDLTELDIRGVISKLNSDKDITESKVRETLLSNLRSKFIREQERPQYPNVTYADNYEECESCGA